MRLCLSEKTKAASWLLEYISIAAVTATYGFALTASPFFKRRNAGPAKGTKRLLPHHSVPRCGSACPHSGIAPWVAAMGHPWPSAAKPASCRFTHCAMPAFGHRGLTGRPNPKPKRGGLTADLTFTAVPGSPVGASRLAMDVNDNAPCLDERVVWTFFASRLAPTMGSRTACNQVGYQAASLWLLLWLLIFLPPREAEWRFCAVGKPAWMPV